MQEKWFTPLSFPASTPQPDETTKNLEVAKSPSNQLVASSKKGMGDEEEDKHKILQIKLNLDEDEGDLYAGNAKKNEHMNQKKVRCLCRHN